MKKKDEYFFDQLNKYYKEWQDRQKQAGHRGSQAEFARAIEDLKRKEPDKVSELMYGECRYQNVSQWLKGTYPNEYLYFICKVLGIEEDDLYPRTHDEKYEHDTPFMNKIKDTEIVPFTEKVGLDIEFLRGLRSVVDFETELPLWTQIGIKGYSINPFSASPEESIGEYVLYPESKLSKSAPMDDGVFQIDRTIDGENKLITMGRVDLTFLQWVQEQVTLYVKFLFNNRREEMQKEVQTANDIHRKESIRKVAGGGICVVDKDVDLTRVDQFIKRAYEVEHKGV